MQLRFLPLADRRRRPRAIVRTLALFALALFIAVGSAYAAGGPPADIVICHMPGTPAEETMTIPETAWEGHAKHHDTKGPCAAPAPTPQELCEQTPGKVWQNGACVDAAPAPTAKELCEAGGGTWSDAEARCLDADEVACIAMGGSMDGICYKWTNLCHTADGGATFSPITVNEADAALYAEHLGHGDVPQDADGSCPAAPAPTTPDDNDDDDDTPAGPGTPPADNQPTGGTTPGGGDTPGGSGDTPGAADAGPATTAQPAADQPASSTTDTAAGEPAATAPPAGDAPADADAGAGGPAATAGAAAAPLAPGRANLESANAASNELPFTGMTPTGTVLAAVLMLLLGACAHGEAARAARRARAAA